MPQLQVIINGAKDRSRLLLQEGLCRFENIDQFIVSDSFFIRTWVTVNGVRRTVLERDSL